MYVAAVLLLARPGVLGKDADALAGAFQEQHGDKSQPLESARMVGALQEQQVTNLSHGNRRQMTSSTLCRRR